MQLQVSVLVLFLATLDATSATTTTNTCLTKHRYTHLRRLAYGVDLTTVDLFPLNHTVDEFLPMPPYLPLFEFTCTNESNLWVDWRSQLVHFPDQIEAVHFYNNSKLKTIGQTTSYTNTKDYLASVIEHIDTGPNEDGVASLSFRFRNGQKHLLSSRSMGRYFANILNMTVILSPETSLKPSSEFLNFTANLTGANYQENPEAFANLLATFGTHWFEKVDFGIMWYAEIAVDDGYFKLVGAHEITQILQPNLQLYVNGQDHLKPEFYAAAKPEMLFGSYGDSPNRLWLIGATRPKPISDLLTDESLKSEVQLAIDVKLAKAYLQSAKYSLQLIQANQEISWLLMGHFEVDNMIGRIDAALGEVVPEEAVLEQIQKEAENYILFAENCKIVVVV